MGNYLDPGNQPKNRPKVEPQLKIELFCLKTSGKGQILLTFSPISL